MYRHYLKAALRLAAADAADRAPMRTGGGVMSHDTALPVQARALSLKERKRKVKRQMLCLEATAGGVPVQRAAKLYRVSVRYEKKDAQTQSESCEPRFSIFAASPPCQSDASGLAVRRVQIVRQDHLASDHRIPPLRYDGFGLFDLASGELERLFVVGDGNCILEWMLEPHTVDACGVAVSPSVRRSARGQRLLAGDPP